MVGHIIKPSIMKYDVKVYKLHEDAVLPSRKSEEAAGFDICTLEDFSLYPGQQEVVSTGLVVQPPPGHHTEIFLRSSLAYKHNIILSNGVGLVDRDYAGPTDELKVMLYRTIPRDGYQEPVHFKKGDRIAQLVFRETELFNIVEVDKAPSLDRGGLGSTGV